jgi:NAD(P)-dependent dehydrogenase (short-subunit alcohol dehydrogenase family)
MANSSPPSSAVIIGAGGGLGTALCEQWQKDAAIDQVIAVSRQPANAFRPADDSSIHFIQSDYSEDSICKAVEKIDGLAEQVTRVCICNGILHNDRVWPEKRIEDLDRNALQEVFAVNSVLPLLWLKALLPVVKGESDCIITVFSARIGSIGDNHSGGWYSYRASKAALNMLLKTAAIEFSRRAKNVKLIAFQPGTTDTNLSKPFHASVKQGNLFTPEFVASHLVDIMDHQSVDGELSFVDWENKPITW